MGVVIAPDKFKGSLTAAQVARHLAAGLRLTAAHVPVVMAPVSDGGDGFLDAMMAAGYRRVPVAAEGADVNNPLTGPQGAAAVYGPQKGASPREVAELDRALAH